MTGADPKGLEAVPVFDVRDVTYRYHQVTALAHLSLRIEAGRRVVLLGANGSGKSTLLRILNALAFPDAGEVRFCGRPLTREAVENDGFGQEFRRRVGLVFQNPDVQLFCPTVFDEVGFGPLQLRWPPERVRREISATLEMMEIGHLKDRSPHHLSTGEKKRVALASVLVMKPEILLLDEPTAALDPQSESRMIDFLVQSKGSGRTIVTTTHDLDIAEDIADDCFVFDQGTVVAAAPPAEIVADLALLKRTNLLHAHLHVHPSGEIHAHPHLHRHGHQD